MDERSAAGPGEQQGHPGQAGQQQGPSMHDVRETSARVRADVDELRREGEALLGQLRSLVDQHPLAAVGAAMGTGYVLSGALVSRTTLRIAMLGARLYLNKMLSRRLGGLAASM